MKEYTQVHCESFRAALLTYEKICPYQVYRYVHMIQYETVVILNASSRHRFRPYYTGFSVGGGQTAISYVSYEHHFVTARAVASRCEPLARRAEGVGRSRLERWNGEKAHDDFFCLMNLCLTLLTFVRQFWFSPLFLFLVIVPFSCQKKKKKQKIPDGGALSVIFRGENLQYTST